VPLGINIFYETFGGAPASSVLAFYKMLFMNKLDFSSLIGLLWISVKPCGVKVFVQVFLFPKSQVQAAEISNPRKPRWGVKSASRGDCEQHRRKYF
jgi:hypothetical protein